MFFRKPGISPDCVYLQSSRMIAHLDAVVPEIYDRGGHWPPTYRQDISYPVPDLQIRYILLNTKPTDEINPAQHPTYKQYIPCPALDLHMRYILPSTKPTDKIYPAQHRTYRWDISCPAQDL